MSTCAKWRFARAAVSMQRKKMTLRFDLDHPEDRQAWEYLQGLNAVSLNRTMVFIINQAERISLMKDEFRSIIREELAAALRQSPCSACVGGAGGRRWDGRYHHGLPGQLFVTAFCRHCF